jgi:NAD-dependent deacetylase
MSDLVVFTGAGISVDSGLRAFRGAGGMWNDHPIDQVANFLTWRDNFDVVHAFYNTLRTQLRGVEPNAAHEAVARWQRDCGATVITQNVDDLHERAGARDVAHVHGRLTEMRCVACGAVWDIGYRAWRQDVERCRCGAREDVKPNVVMFHEVAPLYGFMWSCFESLAPQDLLVVIGASGTVVDIGHVAEAAPCATVLSNLESDPDRVIRDEQFTVALHGRATETAERLDRLVARWRAASGEVARA